MNDLTLHSSIQLAWAVANMEACRGRSTVIEPAHFLLAILKLMDDAYQQDAAHLRLPDGTLAELKELIPSARQMTGLSDAEITAARRGLRRALGSLEEAVAMKSLHRSDAARRLFEETAERAADADDGQLSILHLLASLLENLPAVAAPFFVRVAPHGVASAPAALFNGMGRDLTALAKAGRLPPVVGRKKEMTAVVRFLQRTSKRNVILIGEAGVGKTAIVEGLAQRIIADNAPDFLRSLRIVQINVADLVAGAKYRGDMERRLKRIVEEATANPYIVLFIDEIHLVMQAGSGGGAPLDVANILKPALARDDFRCIGATTTEEYERHIKGESAFARRFQLVRVSEPTPIEALSICEQWARRIEQRQQVTFAPEAVETAVTLSAKLIPGRALPDKAIDLLENAAAYVKVSSLSFRPPMPAKGSPQVGRAEIETVLREQYGIAIAAAEEFEPERVRAALLADLVGQDASIASIVGTLTALRSRSDETAHRPLGVFLFTGPTGVGKTFAAECLARALFGSDRALGRFNMSEYKERHELARLIGAPPGFIGHEQQGALFRFMESHPQGVILLDEMEKAHEEIQDYFLQIFDKAEARDSRGRMVDFRRHLFVLTCNIAGSTAKGVIGFQDAKQRQSDDPKNGLDEVLARHFRREFLGRLDRVVPFRALELADFRALLDRTLHGMESRYGVQLQMPEPVRDQVCAAWFTPQEGARGFLRQVEHQLVSPLQQHLHLHPEGRSLALAWTGQTVAFT